MARIFTKILALFAGLGVALSLVACSLGLVGSAGPTAPCSVTNSKQAADQFLQRVSAQSAVRGKPITFTATSQEVSSVLNEFIQKAKQDSPGGIMPLENPVVCFKNGQMSIFGTINPTGTQPLNALVTIAATVNNSKASFQVQQVQVGSFSVPQSLGDAVSGLVNEALNQSLDQFQLTQISIGNDQITLTGIFQ